MAVRFTAAEPTRQQLEDLYWHFHRAELCVCGHPLGAHFPGVESECCHDAGDDRHGCTCLTFCGAS
jgi:hypothetical protein